MNQELILQDSAISINVENNNPKFLNIDTLNHAGIVPSNWELARQPINTDNVSQVIFANGVAITAEPQRIILAQSIRNVDGESILIPEIACKYIQSEFKNIYTL